MRRARGWGRHWTAAGIALGAATVAVGAALFVARDDDGGDSRTRAGGGSEVVDATERDPGGDPRARISLPPRGKWFGFSGTFFAWTGLHPDLDQGVTAARTASDTLAAGANSARIELSWWDLEPTQGQVNQKYVRVIDDFVRRIERGGGRVLFFLNGPPPWAAELPGQSGSPPKQDSATMEAFRRYVTFVAKRWPRAAAIETWNEPNGSNGWKPGAQPERYARLHRVAVAAIRQANPRIKVLVGGLGATSVDNGVFMRPQRFLKRMYAAGLRPSDYDGLAVHPYPIQGPRSVEPLDGGEFAKAFDDFVKGYRWRDPDAKVWVTETGLTTSGPGAATPAQQSDGVVALTRKLLSMPRVEGLWLYTQYDWNAVPADTRERGFGLLVSRRAGQARPKPAFCALRELVRRPRRFAGCP